ncbi:hypothetical protein [Mucilaginibacter sp.]|uniref:hypothetical protein n=1 Tax=Mucilaginibacter sp. TaxID=1882438 RepID=UPI0035BBA413
MKYWKVFVGAFFIIVGILFFIFLRMLNDPEIEGESGRVSLGEYSLSLIPITIGVVFLLFQKNNRKAT